MIMFLRVCALLGLLLFGAVLAGSWLAPIHAERAAAGFIRTQIEQRVRDTIDELPVGGRFEQAAARLAGRYGEQIDAMRRQLSAQLPERVAAVVARMHDLDCPCRTALAEGVRAQLERRIGSLQAARERLDELVRGAYIDVVRQLLRDIRIVAGTNAAVFLLLLLASGLRPAATAQLMLPGVLLLTTTLVATGLYLFAQDWIFTLLFGSFVGFGYTAWLAGIALLLVDVLLNRARVTTELCNLLLSCRLC